MKPETINAGDLLTEPSGGVWDGTIPLPEKNLHLVSEPTAAPKSSLSRKNVSAAPLRIAVLDDEMLMRVLLYDLLTDQGHQVTCFTYAADALTAVCAETFDALICDIRMPEMDGTEFYAHLTAAKPDFVSRLLFITGDVNAGEIHDFLNRTDARYLVKPFRTHKLLSALNDLIESQTPYQKAA